MRIRKGHIQAKVSGENKIQEYIMIYSWKKILFTPMKTKRYWRQFAIYTVTSVAGMFCTRYIPAEYWPYWFAFSLFIGHVINLFNYAGFKIRWKKRSTKN